MNTQKLIADVKTFVHEFSQKHSKERKNINKRLEKITKIIQQVQGLLYKTRQKHYICSQKNDPEACQQYMQHVQEAVNIVQGAEIEVHLRPLKIFSEQLQELYLIADDAYKFVAEHNQNREDIANITKFYENTIRNVQALLTLSEIQEHVKSIFSDYTTNNKEAANKVNLYVTVLGEQLHRIDYVKSLLHYNCFGKLLVTIDIDVLSVPYRKNNTQLQVHEIQTDIILVDTSYLGALNTQPGMVCSNGHVFTVNNMFTEARNHQIPLQKFLSPDLHPRSIQTRGNPFNQATVNNYLQTLDGSSQKWITDYQRQKKTFEYVDARILILARQMAQQMPQSSITIVHDDSDFDLLAEKHFFEKNILFHRAA